MTTRSSELVATGRADRVGGAYCAEATAAEWMTRYRPVAYQRAGAGAFSPQEEKDFLYAPSGEFHGKQRICWMRGDLHDGKKGRTWCMREFQRAGFFLTHVLECPLDRDAGPGDEAAALLHSAYRQC